MQAELSLAEVQLGDVPQRLQLDLYADIKGERMQAGLGHLEVRRPALLNQAPSCAGLLLPAHGCSGVEPPDTPYREVDVCGRVAALQSPWGRGLLPSPEVAAGMIGWGAQGAPCMIGS